MLAWLYTRKSRHLGDPDDPALLTAHLSALVRLAAADGITIPEANVRAEIGSGERITDRPVFAGLLAEWEALPPGTGGHLYCLDNTRLSRGDPTQTGRIEIALKRAGILVHTTERVYDLNRADDQLFMQFGAALAFYHNNTNKRLVALKRAEMTAAGQVMNGRAPYGYVWIKSPGHQNGRRVSGHIEPDRETFPILQALCREIFTDGVPCLARRYGLPASTIYDLLRCPTICGYPARRTAAHQGTRDRQSAYHRLPRAAWTWPEQPGDYQRACTREEWEAIQQILAQRWTRRGETAAPLENGWAARVVQFGGAPGPCRLGSLTGRGEASIPVYERRRPGLPALYVPRAPVHAAALRALQEIIAQPDRLRQALAEEAARQRQAPLLPPDTTALAERRERERGRLVNLQVDAADPEARPAALAGLRQAVKGCVDEIERLEAVLAALQQPPAARPDLPVLTAALPRLTSADISAEWEATPGDSKAAILANCVASIPVVVTAVPGRRGFQRDVLPAVYADWLGIGKVR